MILNQLNMCIVDIETTGTRYRGHRVIEVGVLKIHQGRCVDTFQTFLNPDRPIPPMITNLTGITDRDVEHAPSFYDIADELYEFLEGHLFVAHNVRFDYGFLRQEFEMVGEKLNLRMMCSVRLSRRLFYRHKRHDLSSIIQRYHIPMKNRHRALDDARAVWNFFEYIILNVDEEHQQKVIKQLLKKPSLPGRLKTRVEDIPCQTGVYIFYNQDDVPLYIGKAKDLRSRVMSHFSSDVRSSKELQLSQQVVRIECIRTEGELAALLLESDMIKKELPLYNRRSRRSWQMSALRARENQDGYLCVEMEVFKQIFKEDMDGIYTIFRKKKQGVDFLEAIAKEYQLCKTFLGIEKNHSQTSCFYEQIKACRGACQKNEAAHVYNIRLLEALKAKRKLRWPFDGPVIIKETALDPGKGESFVVDHWIIQKANRFDGDMQADLFKTDYAFDLDAFRILQGYLNKKHKGVTILPVKDKIEQEPAGLMMKEE